MVDRITAFKASDGKIFATAEEATAHEIDRAADLLVGLSKEGFIAAVSTCGSDMESTRQAIELLARAIPPRAMHVVS